MKNIGVIGIGNLGKALTTRLLKNNLENFVTISDPYNEKIVNGLCEDFNFDSDNNINTVEKSDIIFMTVKPNQIKDVCEDINNSGCCGYKNSKTIITTAAGVNVKYIENKLSYGNTNYNVIRCVPNILISEPNNVGTIIWHKNEKYDYTYLTDTVLNGVNNVYVNDEKLLDVATVLFGCSPAYIASFFDIFVDYGVNMGYEKSEIIYLLSQTFSGTAAYLKNEDSSVLKNQVASKGGATEVGLMSLQKQNRLKNLMLECLSLSSDKVEDIRKTLD